MRAYVRAVVVVVGMSVGVTFAQDAPKPEQLRKMYDDALAQLKAAQDRKTELAQQNEQLTARVNALTKELESLRGEMVELRRRDADNAERSFLLRSHHAAWQTFLEAYPEMKARWDVFLGTRFPRPEGEASTLIDTSWPLALEG